MSARTIRVAELFAGVGGFRIGLERSGGYRVVFSNQWEPGTRVQHASALYVRAFGADGHTCCDIATLRGADLPTHDLLVAGFPCQDYSVARPRNQSQGLKGKKGVLWWEIVRLLREMPAPPTHLLLENVDRLLRSPAKRPGRDFAVILSSLAMLGYAVEWRVLNAAELGHPQRRKRLFIYAYRLLPERPVFTPSTGFFVKAFGLVDIVQNEHFPLVTDPASVSRNFNRGGKRRFWNAGTYSNGVVRTAQVALLHQRNPGTLGQVLLPESHVPARFFIPRAQLSRWRATKGAKRLQRTTASGHTYHYAEGAMAFPDPTDRPARTLVTSEGSSSPNRSTHVVRTASGRYRRLLPVELERLNGFPDGHTGGLSDTRRAFLMGNALVTGLVEQMGRTLLEQER